jgi:hypothetical protein
MKPSSAMYAGQLQLHPWNHFRLQLRLLVKCEDLLQTRYPGHPSWHFSVKYEVLLTIRNRFHSMMLFLVRCASQMHLRPSSRFRLQTMSEEIYEPMSLIQNQNQKPNRFVGICELILS